MPQISRVLLDKLVRVDGECETRGQKIERLISELQHKNPEVRHAAAVVLRNIDTPKTLNAIKKLK